MIASENSARVEIFFFYKFEYYSIADCPSASCSLIRNTLCPENYTLLFGTYVPIPKHPVIKPPESGKYFSTMLTKTFDNT